METDKQPSSPTRHSCVDCGTLKEEDLQWALERYDEPRNHDIARILQANGFEPLAVICKVAGKAKSSIGIPQACETIGAAMCNPILQARLLNEARTDLNVVIGLCVGHDSLFYKYSEAYATTLVTKDRVTGNNPAAALYTAESYYRKKFGLKG